MSVLIKDIKMPKCCSDCPLEYDQMRCSIAGYNWYDQDYLDIGFDPNKDRLPECPLIEFPEHHGRLIDADEMRNLWAGCSINGSILPLLDARPTVVEAE